MDKFQKTTMFLCFLVVFFHSSSYAQNNSCDYVFPKNAVYRACNTLPALNSFLHWNYHPTNHTVDIAYRHTRISSTNWVAWSLNPTAGGMVGAQCLVAFANSSSGGVRSYTSPISSYGTTLQEAPLSFRVPSHAAEFSDGQMIIYATIELPQGRTSFPNVWQHGGISSSGNLLMHHINGDNMRSLATIDFVTGTTTDTTSAAAGGSRQRQRNIHGVLNVMSWGIMLPLGAMAARYLKMFKAANPAWFYLHVVCQSSAYIVGVAGWATGLKLGSDSEGVERTTHRNIGFTLFVFGTLQVIALLLRPKPEHKLRFYWNIYHQSVGYAVIALSIINIFQGFDILDPEKKWKRAYIGVLIFLGASFVVLEAFTWFIVLKRKRCSDKQPQVQDTPNGYNSA